MSRNAPEEEHRSYFAECFSVGVTERDLAEIEARAGRAAEDLTREGHTVAYVGSILMPEDEVVLIQFEAQSSADAAAAATRAGISFERVVESVNRRRDGTR
jgi:hypothetical protein